MAWTSPITWVANTTALTAATLNTHLRDNLNYLKGLLDGTGSDTVTVPGQLRIDNDAVFYLDKAGSDPIVVFDSGNDYLIYSRAGNSWTFTVGAAAALTVGGTGKLTGIGFYDSGNTTVGAGATVNFAHGLGARPRFVGGWYDATAANLSDTSSTMISPLRIGSGSGVQLLNADVTNLAINNTTGGSLVARVFAIE